MIKIRSMHYLNGNHRWSCRDPCWFCQSPQDPSTVTCLLLVPLGFTKEDYLAAEDEEAIWSAKIRLGSDCGSDHELFIPRRVWRVLWTARRSNQWILKGISPEYSLEGLMLKPQYSGHLMRRSDSSEKILMLGKIEGRRRGRRGQDGWMASPTHWTWVWASGGRWVKDRESWHAVAHGAAESLMTEQLNNNLIWI